MLSLPQSPSPGDMLLITDELSSPADFILHADLAAHLKDTSRDAQCIVISVSESLSRWKAVASKNNFNIPHFISKGSLVFVDLMSNIAGSNYADEGSLRPVFDDVCRLLQTESYRSAHTLLIIDDISTLEWIGFSVKELSRFARAICAISAKQNTSLIIRHHIVTPGAPDDLLRTLLQLCAIRMDVFPLSTGRSGSVSGQLALYPGYGRVGTALKTVPRSRAVLYRLTDAGCVFFERGTGAAVL